MSVEQIVEHDIKPKVGEDRSKLPNGGNGRPKGATNKNTRAIKDMILKALDDVGGVEYLAKQANENPTAFLTLVGKVLPMTIAGDPEAPVLISRIELVGPSDHGTDPASA